MVYILANYALDVLELRELRPQPPELSATVVAVPFERKQEGPRGDRELIVVASLRRSHKGGFFHTEPQFGESSVRKNPLFAGSLCRDPLRFEGREG